MLFPENTINRLVRNPEIHALRLGIINFRDKYSDHPSRSFLTHSYGTSEDEDFLKRWQPWSVSFAAIPV